MLAMRPPIDLPPITSRPPPPSREAISRHASSSTASRSGAPRRPPSRRARMYGNSKRTTRMLVFASPSAIVFMNGESIMAPAPCARTTIAVAFFGPSISRSPSFIFAPSVEIRSLPARLHRANSLYIVRLMATQSNRPTLSSGSNWRAGANLDGRYFGDVYHHLITASWPYLLFLISATFVVINCLFALAYMLDGGVENARPGSFADVFFFSVQTMATIGYGKLAPATLIANILMSVEALSGLVSLALVTGLIFTKFSRPTARVRFTRNVVVSMRDGVPSVMFRMANVRANPIVETQLHVVFARHERTLEGEYVRRFYH